MPRHAPRRNVPTLLLFAAIAALLLLAPRSVAHAQDQSLHWERFDVTINVLESGHVEITEHNEVNFTSGLFNFGYRDIQIGRTTGIGDIRVVADGVTLDEVAYDTGEHGTFYTEINDDTAYIKYYFPEADVSGRHSVDLSYTVEGALRYYEDGDQLWWKAVYDDRPAEVYESVVTVNLPPNAPAERVESYGADAISEISNEGRTVTFTSTGVIPTRRELEVRVQFPHGVVAGSPAPWQADADREVAQQERVSGLNTLLNYLFPFGSLVALVGGLVALYLNWRARGRDPEVALVANYLSEPPDGTPPGVVGTLLNEKADMRDVMATLVGLAQRGAIRITELEPEKSFFGSESHDYRYELLDKSIAKGKAETLIINRLFSGGQREVEVSELRNKFYSTVPKVKNALYDEVVSKAWFASNPAKVRSRYIGLGITVALLMICGGFMLTSILQGEFNLTPAIACLPFSLALLGIAAAIIGPRMPAKTQLGSEAASKWRAFKRYLDEIERYPDEMEKKRELWDAYLPYAIAFGMEDRYMKMFEQVGAQVPTWYNPYGYSRGTYYGSDPASGNDDSSVFTSSSGGRSGGLQGASDSMALGLQGMSNGLASMLSTTAST
ncbi:MAG: DUF2207 domain-containing protein, partial [Anaerolineales bacterium]|nr:DUF2207 domain-containing protein [Anaerolineales bacterium]